MIYCPILSGWENWWSIYFFWDIFVLLLTSRFANNRSRFSNLFTCFANVQFANNLSRFANVFSCSKYISLLSERMPGLQVRLKWEVGDFDQVEDHSLLLLPNILAHAFFSSLQIIHANSSRIVTLLNIRYFYRVVLFGDYEIFEWDGCHKGTT